MKTFLIKLWKKLFDKTSNIPSVKVVSKPVEACEDNCTCKKSKEAKKQPLKAKTVKKKKS